MIPNNEFLLFRIVVSFVFKMVYFFTDVFCLHSDKFFGSDWMMLVVQSVHGVSPDVITRMYPDPEHSQRWRSMR